MANKNQRSRNQQRQAELARRQQRGMTPSADLDATAIIQQTWTQAWQGPLPKPEDLRKYEEVHPGLAERIVVMAEKTVALTEQQTDHRIAMEAKMLGGLNRRANIGLWLAFLLALAVLGPSIWLISIGREIGGTALGGIDLVGLVGIFIYGRRDQADQENARTTK